MVTRTLANFLPDSSKIAPLRDQVPDGCHYRSFIWPVAWSGCGSVQPTVLVCRPWDVDQFEHERLDVCRASIEFLAIADQLAENLPRGRTYVADQRRRPRFRSTTVGSGVRFERHGGCWQPDRRFRRRWVGASRPTTPEQPRGTGTPRSREGIGEWRWSCSPSGRPVPLERM